MKTVFFVIVSLFLSFSVFAQVGNTGTLSGKLKSEENNEAVDFAMVILMNANTSSPVKSFMTENDGYFLFEEVPFGTYRIKVTFIGFETKIIDDIVIDKDNFNRNLGTLKLKQATNTLEEIVIKDTKSPIEFNGDTVTYNVDQSLMAVGSSASDVLKNVPMVSVDIDGKPTIAGKMNTRIFLDGKPSDYTSATMTDLLNVLPADAIQKIEVITNPDVRYSADGDGIINIVLKKGFKIGLNGALSFTAGTLGNYNTSLYTAYRDEKLSLSGSYGFKDATNDVNVATERTNFNSAKTISSFQNQLSDSESGNSGHNMRLSADWDITKKQNLRLSANFNTSVADGLSHLDDYRLNSSAIETALYLQDNKSSRNSVNGVFNADYTYKIGKKNESLTAGFTYFKNGLSTERELFRVTHKPKVDPVEYMQGTDNEIGSRRLEFNLDYRKPITRFTNLSIGIQSTFNKNGNDQEVYGYDFKEQRDTIKPVLTNEFIYSENVLAAYGSYSLRTKKRFSFRVGVRTEYTDLNFIEAAVSGINPKPYLNFFPNASINKVYKKKHNFGLSYSKRIARPREYALNPLIDDSNQSNVSFGNPELLPSYTHQFQFSFGTFGQKWSFTPRIGYAITGDIIERFRIHEDSVTYQNLATTRSWSYNMFGNYRPTKSITMAGGVSVSRVAYESKSAIQPSRVGLSYRANGSLSGQFPHKIAAEGQVNYYNNTNSQGRSQGSVSLALGARKTFLENKLLIRIMANDPLSNRITSDFTDAVNANGSSYEQDRKRTATTTNYSLTISYRFTKVGRNTVNKQKEDKAKEEIKTVE